MPSLEGRRCGSGWCALHGHLRLVLCVGSLAVVPCLRFCTTWWAGGLLVCKQASGSVTRATAKTFPGRLPLMPRRAAATASTVLLHGWWVGGCVFGPPASFTGCAWARLFRNSLARNLSVLCVIRAAVCSSACEAGGCPVTVSS